eukprot:TRINITY_DN4439_c0_g1_i11.p2 TRINITY_DN4439_c0_g1~~TRINITY_DN4439_c0_g1_i11.p2  ORF type:complete len:200 (-),score=37.38 TRINITY_DN4439_c0_g1_i11:232-831(-)
MSTGASIFKKRMISYLSLGGNARMDAEKYEEKSSVWKRCRYCWESCKWLCCLSVKASETLLKITKLDENKEDETDIAVVPIQETTDDIYLDKDSASVVFLNVGGLMSGTQNPWRSILGEFAMNSKRTNLEENFKDENFSDGLMEILAFTNGASSTSIAERAKKVAQDSGPFKLMFQGGKVLLNASVEEGGDGEHRRRVL